DRRRRLVDDRVLGRAPVLEREIEARELQFDADHVGRERPQGLLEELLPRLVALEDDDRVLVSHRLGSVEAGWVGPEKGARGRFATTTSAGARFATPRRSSGSRSSRSRLP